MDDKAKVQLCIQLIENFGKPVVDAVPVIRCWECKHWGMNGCPMHIKGKAADDTLLTAVDDDFCPYGRLK